MSSVAVLDCASGAASIACGDVPTGGLATISVEGWFRVAALSAANRPLLAKYGAAGHEWALYVTRDGRVYWTVFDSGGVNAAYTETGVVLRGQWQHLAGCYNGTACKVFVDGADATLGGRLHGGTVLDTTQAMQIGGYIGSASVGFIGRVGWCRVSSICRYPAAVAMPDQYPHSDADTLGLWHMAEGSGETVDNAEGTAANDGVISGATWATSMVEAKRRAAGVHAGQWGRSWAGAAVTG